MNIQRRWCFRKSFTLLTYVCASCQLSEILYSFYCKNYDINLFICHLSLKICLVSGEYLVDSARPRYQQKAAVCLSSAELLRKWTEWRIAAVLIVVGGTVRKILWLCYVLTLCWLHTAHFSPGISADLSTIFDVGGIVGMLTTLLTRLVLNSFAGK